MPRRRSDTQQKGSAIWEFAHTLKASQLGVSPNIYKAWYARHATPDYPSGLYVVTDLFEYDIHTYDGTYDLIGSTDTMIGAIML